MRLTSRASSLALERPMRFVLILRGLPRCRACLRPCESEQLQRVGWIAYCGLFWIGYENHRERLSRSFTDREGLNQKGFGAARPRNSDHVHAEPVSIGPSCYS